MIYIIAGINLLLILDCIKKTKRIAILENNEFNYKKILVQEGLFSKEILGKEK